MELVSVECPNCGAALPPREPTGHYRCDYCSTPFELQQARGAKTQYGVAVSPQELAKAIVDAQHRMREAHVEAETRSRQAAQARGARMAQRVARRVVVTAVAITFLGAIIPVVIMLVSTGAVQKAVSQIPGAQNIPAITEIAEIVETSEHLLWDDVAGPPQPVEIGGKPCFIGRTRKVLENDQLFVDAYDAATVARVWRLGPLGSYADGYQSTLFAAAGGRVVVSDHRSTLRLLDLATGEEVQSLSLTDRVEYLCTSPDPDSADVWVSQVDERAHLLDVKTGELTEAKRPKWCHKGRWDAKRAAERAPRRKAVPKVDGFKPQRLKVDGSTAVAVGVKHPGTPVPGRSGLTRRRRN